MVFLLYEDCMNEVLELLQSITEGKKEVDDDDPETELNVNINAIVANNAEHYYRTMITDDNESWNIQMTYGRSSSSY